VSHDTATEELADLFATAIVDPINVISLVLQSAALIADVTLTIERVD